MMPPRTVRDLADKLRQHCHTEPVVEFDPGHTHWRITVSNDRVVMTLDHKMTLGRTPRWVWASSTLTIDGVRGPIAENFEHFLRVWENPEEMANRAPVPPPISTPVNVMDLDSMPSYIADAVRQIVKLTSFFDPVAGYVNEHFWAIEFSLPRAVLRMHWYRNSDQPKPCSDLFLIVDGEDKSDLAKGQMDKALAIITSIPHPGVAGTASVDGEVGPQRDRGVEVRDTHVMRN